MRNRDCEDPAEMSDADLLGRSATDPEAFGVFYDRHVKALLAFFYRRTTSAETAADLTAETFAVAYEHRRRFRDQGVPARAWLLGIARHQLSRALRRGRVDRRARQRLGMEPVSMDDLSLERIEELADLEPIRRALTEAIASLSPKLAEAVLLRVGAELPYPEVARRLGCTEGAARVRVARGLSRIAEMIGEY